MTHDDEGAAAELERMIAAERAVTPDPIRREVAWDELRGRVAAASAGTATAGVWARIAVGVALAAATAATVVALVRERPAAAPEVTPELPRAVAPAATPAPAVQEEDEVRSLRAVYMSLKAGDHAAVLAAAERHAQRWPQGLFDEEIAAARVLALCGLEREGSQEELASFLRAWPDSLQAPRVRQACAAIP